MYKSATAIAAAIALSTVAFTPATAGPYSAGIASLQQTMTSPAGQEQLVHKTGKKGKFAIGFAIGLGTAAALGAGYGYHGGYDYSFRRMCRRLRHRCWNGNHKACWKYENRC